MTPLLFGRSAELQRLDDVLAGAAAGTGHLVFIEGEPGIGKTALIEEATARARDLGFAIFAGRAEELEQDRPFLAIAAALGCTVSASGGRRVEIARLLGAGPGQDGVFYRLIDAFQDLVETEALCRPALLTIDDLQWADPGTIRALGSISRRAIPLPVAILGTLRKEPRSEDLTGLLRATSSFAIRMAMAPLDHEAVAEMASVRLHTALGPKLSAHLEGAGGNPLYVTEVLDALEAGSLIHVSETCAEIEGPAMPPSLVLTLLHRLSDLPEQVLDIVRSASVLGASFTVEDLATAAGVGDVEAQEAVRELRSHGVFADDQKKVRFRHDLIREAVYEDLGRPLRASMHRSIGRSLAKAGASPLEVAGHLVRGALPGDTEAADWMIEAAADPAMDPLTTMAMIERALELNPEHPQRSKLVPRLAWLIMTHSKPSDAIPHLHRLLPQLSELSERLDVVEALMTASFSAGRTHETRAWAKQVRELVPQAGDAGRPDGLLCLSWATQLEGDLEGALALADRAATLARGTGAKEAEANQHACWLLTLLCRSGEAVARSEQSLSVPGASPTYWARHAWALGDLDRIDEAEAALAVARTLAEEAGFPLIEAKVIMESAHLRYSLGRWDDALIDAETAAAISDEFDIAYTGPDPGTVMSWIAYHRSDATEFERVWEMHPSRESGNPPLRPTLRAAAALAHGSIDEARRRARDLIARIASSPTERRDFDVLPVLARIALAVGDTAYAHRARDTAAHLAQGSDAPGVVLADARCRAIVDGDPQAAKRAVELARASPRRLLAAGALEEAAELLDRDEAAEALTEALHLYERMGAVRDHARVAVRLQGFHAVVAIAPVRRRAISGWNALTGAELDVVRLAADGLTNREIGSRLFVSHRTVATHLSHVFDKLGLRSRVELAREAVQRFGGAARENR